MKKNLLVLFIVIFISGCSLNQKSVTTSYNISTTKSVINDTKSETSEQIVTTIDSNISFDENNDIKTKSENIVALIVPSSQIGKYYQEIVNGINSFLIYKHKDYRLKVVDIVVQNKQNLVDAVKLVKDSNITKVISMVTPEFLIKLDGENLFEDLTVYFPIVNTIDVGLDKKYQSDNFLFGGISYKKQIDFLLKDKNYTNLVELYDDSIVGERLHLFTSNYKLKYSRKVDDNNRAYKWFLKNRNFKNSVLILNTPIVKSSILLSQLRALDVELDTVLSTQLNYTPLILSLTQKHDRKNVYMANAIGNIPTSLKEINSLLDNGLEYDWVSYSIILGMEYLIGDISTFTDIKIVGNQIEYPINLYKVRQNSFKKIKR